jgi:hypothetical protein
LGGGSGARRASWLIVMVIGMFAPFTFGLKFVTDVYYAFTRIRSERRGVRGFVQVLIEARTEFARVDRLLPVGEQLIAKLEENMDVSGIMRLLDMAPLDAHRRHDGVTPIMATVRYVNGGNYQNTHRRLKWLWEIASRLPPDRLKAALDAQDWRGWTALMYAADQMDALGIDLLRHLGATPEIPVDVPTSDLQRKRIVIELGRAPVPAFSKLVNTLERFTR